MGGDGGTAGQGGSSREIRGSGGSGSICRGRDQGDWQSQQGLGRDQGQAGFTGGLRGTLGQAECMRGIRRTSGVHGRDQVAGGKQGSWQVWGAYWGPERDSEVGAIQERFGGIKRGRRVHGGMRRLSFPPWHHQTPVKLALGAPVGCGVWQVGRHAGWYTEGVVCLGVG